MWILPLTFPVHSCYTLFTRHLATPIPCSTCPHPWSLPLGPNWGPVPCGSLKQRCSIHRLSGERWGRSSPGSSCFFQAIFHPLGFWDPYEVTLPLSKSPRLCQLPACWALTLLSQRLSVVSSPPLSCVIAWASWPVKITNHVYAFKVCIFSLWPLPILPSTHAFYGLILELLTLRTASLLMSDVHIVHSDHSLLKSHPVVPTTAIGQPGGVLLTWSTNFSLHVISSLLASLFC